MSKINLIFLLVGVALFISCSKSPKCWGDDKEKGIINSVLIVPCVPITENNEFFISSKADFQQIFFDSSINSSTCNLPEVDFNQYSVLGVSASGTCNVKFIREVIKNEDSNNYHYKVTVKSCGNCKKLALSYNWVTVPKLPQNWSITYEVENK